LNDNLEKVGQSWRRLWESKGGMKRRKEIEKVKYY